jgi:diguanylate cyclase (GGDEF)-like protein
MGKATNKLASLNGVLIFALGMFFAIAMKGFDLVMERHPPFRNYPLLPFCWVSVVVIAYYVNKRAAIVAALLIAIGWFATTPTSSSDHLVEVINRFFSLMYCAFFVFFSIPLANYMSLLRKAREATWKDDATEALNAPFFFQRVSTELSRARRYQRTVTVAYVSINDFGGFSKLLGSRVAGSLLAVTAEVLIKGLRSADVVGRVADDAFGVLLPETGYDQAHCVMPRLQQSLLTAMKQRNWSPTFAICAVTCTKAPASLDGLIALVQAETARAKAEHKSEIVYKEWEDGEPAPAPVAPAAVSSDAQAGMVAQER